MKVWKSERKMTLCCLKFTKNLKIALIIPSKIFSSQKTDDSVRDLSLPFGSFWLNFYLRRDHMTRK